MPEDSLKGMVILAFGSQRKFADKIKWNKNKVCRAMKGQGLSSDDMVEITKLLPMQKTADKLGMTWEQLFVKIFFPSASPIGTNN